MFDDNPRDIMEAARWRALRPPDHYAGIQFTSQSCCLDQLPTLSVSGLIRCGSGLTRSNEIKIIKRVVSLLRHRSDRPKLAD